MAKSQTSKKVLSHVCHKPTNIIFIEGPYLLKCRHIWRKAITNKLKKDFNLQVRYLYFKVNFNFICTAKFLTFLDDSRIYSICTSKFLTFSNDGEIWYDLFYLYFFGVFSGFFFLNSLGWEFFGNCQSSKSAVCLHC